jgi:hypothetical protein
MGCPVYSSGKVMVVLRLFGHIKRTPAAKRSDYHNFMDVAPVQLFANKKHPQIKDGVYSLSIC